MRSSVRFRLTLAFIGLAIGPLVVVGAVLAQLSFSTQQAQALTLQQQIAQRVATEIDGFVRQLEHDLRLTSQVGGLPDLAIDEQRGLLFELLGYQDAFDELTLLDSSGRERVRLARLEIVTPADLGTQAGSDAFLIPQTTGATYYSPVMFDEDTGEPLLIIGVPLPDPRRGTAAGVLVAKARFKKVWDLIASAPAASGQSVYMVDAAGRVIAHRNPSVVLRGTRFTPPAESGVAGGLDTERAVLAVERLQLGQQVFTIVAERSLGDALALSINTVAITAAITLVALLLAGVVGIRIIHQVVRPIQSLAETARAIRSGDLSRRAAVMSHDEFEELAEAFNSMTARLQETLEGLEQRVSELKQAEAALRASEERYRSIFEDAHEGIFRRHPNGAFSLVNPALVRMLGYDTAEEVLALRVPEDLYSDPDELGPLRARLDDGEQLAGVEMRWRKKSGEPIVVSVYGRMIRDTGDAYATYEGMVLDITERKRAEAEREALIKELEAKNSELERFTYTVSHDLKSPLITIRGFLNFIEQDARAGNLERLSADLARVGDAAGKMHRMLDELLALSRVGRIMNPPELVPLGDLAREAAALVDGRLAARGCRVEIAADLPPVYGDRARLLEVLQNLLDNAAKFIGDQPAPTITVGMRHENGAPVFFVRDNGIGIDPRYHARVFGLFDKLDPRGEGTGVGLALVKRIVELHGGRVWIESAGEGAGATCCFTLPQGP